ncbi:FtsK/SpoIIIE domain-containing protein [Bacillus sp. SCS-151]|uniref:FtsK/SpoIIIE domain-containing protein n=1 Tax=Nanhaiella sioensis TaxID=3115293 RepID=UPI00397AC162
MFSSVTRKLYKTPVKNSSAIIKKIDRIDETLIQSLLTSPYLGEGVFGYEQFSTGKEVEGYIITPSIVRLETGRVEIKQWDWLLKESNVFCYVIQQSKPAFLPIYQEGVLSIFKDIKFLSMDNQSIFIQLLFSKRCDNWRDTFISQYAAYLKGNDLPSIKKLSRSFQSKMLSVLDKITNFKSERSEIQAIEDKILDEGYRVEIRLLVLSNENDKLEIVESEIKELLEEFDYFNELKLKKIKNKKSLIQSIVNRSFSLESQESLFSEKELITLIGCEASKGTKAMISDLVGTRTKTVYNNLIDLLPFEQSKDRKLDEFIINEIPSALKRSRATKTSSIDIVDIDLGATVQCVTFKIPGGVIYSEIKNKQLDIQAVLGTEINIVQGKQPNTITFLIPCSKRDIIYLKSLLENPQYLGYASENPLPFVCGIDMYNQPVYKCLTKAPHLLVSGATNSGKSVFINSLLITLILLRNPNELRIFLIDPKKVEFIQYKGISHIESIVTDMNEAIITLSSLVKEMEKRYETLSLANCKNITSFNEKSVNKLPYIVCAIDEYNDLRISQPEVETFIERLGQKARAAGIHLIIATQRPDKEVMSGVIKTNLPSRISFKLDNSNEYKTVFGTGIPFKNLLGFGDGVVKYVGQHVEFIRFQAPVISLDEGEEENVYKSIVHNNKENHVENVKVVDSVEEKIIDKLKRVIANTGETRITELRKAMGIRINNLHELVRELVDERWLEKQGKSYVIVADENELNKWRDQQGKG